MCLPYFTRDKSLLRRHSSRTLPKTVSAKGVADNGGANPTSGYTIVKADNIEAACEMANTNPMVADGGSVEVAEIHVIEM